MGGFNFKLNVVLTPTMHCFHFKLNVVLTLHFFCALWQHCLVHHPMCEAHAHGHGKHMHMDEHICKSL